MFGVHSPLVKGIVCVRIVTRLIGTGDIRGLFSTLAVTSSALLSRISESVSF
jgi:hypothetical protein